MMTVTPGILTTTAGAIPGRSIRTYLGVVSGDAIVTLHGFRRGGGRPGPAIPLDLQRARGRVLRTLARRANDAGATVVVAVTFAYTDLYPGKIVVSATGS